MCLHPNKYAFEFFSYSTVTVKWSGAELGGLVKPGRGVQLRERPKNHSDPGVWRLHNIF